jgi:hypothetical protein
MKLQLLYSEDYSKYIDIINISFIFFEFWIAIYHWGFRDDGFSIGLRISKEIWEKRWADHYHLNKLKKARRDE